MSENDKNTVDSERRERVFKPSEFMKTRRPEEYPDSTWEEEGDLTQLLLEYHLDSLTSRSQEKEFEHFARKLSEKELCPNLLPQTGPTGGGDSKVDSETYPVAKEISNRWYQGIDGAENRWAFAFSAMKEWRPKIKSDVKKIVGTERDYSLIFFITNQFVSDKKRAQVEDELTKEYGIPVRLLDRSWIVDRVLNHGNRDLAIETLSIEGLQFSNRKVIGPRDAYKETMLLELDTDIKNTDRYNGVSFQLVEDILTGAKLASELGHDRHEIDGRFAAALRIAREGPDTRQIIRVLYRHAWVSMFVFDDVNDFKRRYDEIAAMVLETDRVDNLELLHNLWQVLFGNASVSDPGDMEEIIHRSDALLAQLESLGGDNSRPNNAAHARTILCIHQLTLQRTTPEDERDFTPALNGLKDEIANARGLGRYPFEAFKHLIFEIGEFFIDHPAYEALFETVVEVSEERNSEGETANMLTDRALQKLQNGKPYDALRFVGRAQDKLVKEEYQEGFLKCLMVSAAAYNQVGLKWAARSNFMAVLSNCIAEFSSSGHMYSLALLAAKELCFLELKLGRVTNTLHGYILASIIATQLDLDDEGENRFAQFREQYDLILATLLIKSDREQLQLLTKYPHFLDKYQLVFSMATLLFAFDGPDSLRSEGYFDEKTSNEEAEKLFETFCLQPAYQELPDKPAIYTAEQVFLESRVIGISISVKADNNLTSIAISESVLTAFESFLATSLQARITPFKDCLSIRVRSTTTVEGELGVAFRSDENGFEIVIEHVSELSLDSDTQARAYKDLIIQMILKALSQVCIIADGGASFLQMIEDENVIGRTLLFIDIGGINQSTFGEINIYDPESIVGSIDEEPYPIIRKSLWRPKPPAQPEPEPLKVGEGDPPESLSSLENASHDNIVVASMVNLPAWDKASWCGSAFVHYPDNDFPPTLGLMFQDEGAAREIFQDWVSRLDKYDSTNKLRIVIVTGIDKNNPHYYRIKIGTNLNTVDREKKKSGFMILPARIQSMSAETPENLDFFLQEYKRYRCFCLMPVIYNGNVNENNVLKDIYLIKQELMVIPAWKIERHNDDMMVLAKDDDPIIPEGIDNAPVLEALRVLRSR